MIHFNTMKIFIWEIIGRYHNKLSIARFYKGLVMSVLVSVKHQEKNARKYKVTKNPYYNAI